MTVSNMTLVKIAAIGGMATVTMGLLARGKFESNIKKSAIYKEALRLVRSHPAAVNLLGEPIKDRTIDIDDHKKNYTKDNEAHFEVPLKGSKQKGTLYFWANRINEDSPWALSKVEVDIEKIPDKRLLIKKPENVQ